MYTTATGKGSRENGEKGAFQGRGEGGKGLTILGVVIIVATHFREADSQAERGVIGTPHADEATEPCPS
jgi:hypothetical protein